MKDAEMRFFRVETDPLLLFPPSFVLPDPRSQDLWFPGDSRIHDFCISKLHHIKPIRFLI